MRAAAQGLRVAEVPVGQRRRAGGVSKVSGDLLTSLKVVWVLLRTFIRIAGQVGPRKEMRGVERMAETGD
jgi:hypothetical protein